VLTGLTIGMRVTRGDAEPGEQVTDVSAWELQFKSVRDASSASR